MPEVDPIYTTPTVRYKRVYLRPGGHDPIVNRVVVDEEAAGIIKSCVLNGQCLVFTEKDGTQWAFDKGYIKVMNIKAYS